MSFCRHITAMADLRLAAYHIGWHTGRSVSHLLIAPSRSLHDTLSAGWKIGASMFANRIMHTLSLMRDALPKVLPRSRSAVDDYFVVWWWVAMMVTGLQNSSEVELNTSSNRFQEYIDMEEVRLRGNLEKVNYDVDASDTLSLVMGAGGLEKVRVSLVSLPYLIDPELASELSSSHMPATGERLEEDTGSTVCSHRALGVHEVPGQHRTDHERHPTEGKGAQRSVPDDMVMNSGTQPDARPLSSAEA